MIIIGIDPSLTSTGICVMNENGKVLESIALTSKYSGAERLGYLSGRVRGVLNSDSYDNIQVFIEGYSMGTRNAHVERLGEWGGAMRLTLHQEGIQYVEIPPSTLKKFATGKGNADKIAMGVALQKQFGLEYPTSDQTDAYFLAEFGRAYLGLIPSLTKEKVEVIEKLRNPEVKKKVAKK